MKCAIYTRVSTDNQVEIEFNSCESQEEKIRAFISSQEDMTVFNVYKDEGYSGADLNRPAMQEMLKEIASSPTAPRNDSGINVVIVYKMDRLTRSPKDFYQLIELFEKHGVDFISVTERFDTSTPSGRLLRNIMLTFAQFERELASERTKDKMLQRASKGMWNGGLVPFGYKVENKKLVIKKDDAKILKQIYDSYLLHGSIFKIYKETGLSKSRISYILRNIIYTGKIKYIDKIYEGNHEAIISEEVFNLAQGVHKEKHRKMRIYKDYALAGLLKCKECSSHMTPCHTNKKRKGRTKHYYYYRCTKTFKENWDSCDIKQINANRLESYVFQNLERISLDRQYIESSIFKLNNSQSGDRIGLEPLVESQKISPEIFEQTLCLFVKGLSERKGIDKNIWVKNFIKKIIYSKEEIFITFYYKRSFGEEERAIFGSGRVGATAAENAGAPQGKKITHTPRCMGNVTDMAPDLKFARTVDIILPNTIHGCKNKNLS